MKKNWKFKNWWRKLPIENGRKSWKTSKIGKILKTGKLKWGRLGHYRNRQEAGKKCSEQLRSSSIDGSCQMVRTGTEKRKNGQHVLLDFGAEISTRYCWRLIFWRFSFRGGSEKLNFALQNKFSSKSGKPDKNKPTTLNLLMLGNCWFWEFWK